MSVLDDYNAAKKKRKKESGETTVVESDGSVMGDYYAAKAKRESGTPNGSIGFSDIAPLYSSLDIAPTVTTKKEDDRKWFQKGAFEDGYQFGDVMKTILGTTTDVTENVGSSVLGLGEKLVDTATWLGASQVEVPWIAKLFMPADYREKVEQAEKKITDKAGEFIAKDLYNEEKIAKQIISNPFQKMTGIDSEKDSVLGEKSDSLVQSGGQLLAQAGLQALGVPWFVTAGVSSFGSEAENALNEGADFGEAGLSATVSAGAEILTEKISGGIKFGGKTLDEGVTKLIASRISDKTVRTLAKLGVDMVGEGGEEILSGVMGAIGQKISYADDKELSELFSAEDAWESFIGGAVLGGVSNGFQVAKSNKKGVDYTTGLTKNEQAVVDRVYQDLTKDVKSEKEKSKIYDEVLDQLEKGYISTETIEEVLGGDTFNQYRDTVNNEDELIHEFEELGKKQNATLEEQTRYQKLSGQVEDIQKNSQRGQLKTQLSQEVFNLVKGDKLVESYNEKARRTQKYEADLTKYDVNQQKTIQKAIDSGVLNNTRRTHEFVDLVAKISADKGVLFDFTNNQKLKESGFAVDGKVVNGFVTKDGITLNTQSSKYLNSVVGHEITHVLEGTEVYNELQKVLFDYAKSKGDYQSRFDSLSDLYKNIKDADIEAELTADLVGDYLFTDQDFIKNLSVNNKTVFEKIFDEIKYLWKVATGTKEEKELAKVKRAFEEAYRARGKNSGTKYSISDSTGKELTKEQQDYFKDSKVRDENGNLIKVYHSSPTAGFTVFEGSEGQGNYKYGEYGESITFFTDSKTMADSYSPSDEKVDTRKLNNLDEAREWIESIGFDLEIREDNGNYELLDSDESVATFESEDELLRNLKRTIQEEYGDIYSGGQYEGYVNIKNPLEVDAEGRPWDRISEEFSQEIYDKFQSLTPEEKEALHDLAGWEDASMFVSEVRSADANSPDEYTRNLANAFNKLKGSDGYVNLFNLFDIASDNFTEEAIRESATVTLSTNDYVERALQDGSYDGVIIKNVIDYGGHAHSTVNSPAGNDYIVFNSNQFKAADNLNPTEDADIRYSLSDSDGRQLSKEQSEYFKGSKVTDESGKLKAVYHGSPADFNTFSLEYLGTNGTAEGYGFYFTDKKSIAENYSKGHEGQQNGESGKLFECYLDIKKPLSDTKVTMSRAQFKKFLTTLNNQVDSDGEPLDILSNYGDVSWEGLNNVLNYAMEIEYDGSDSDVNLVHSIINGCGNMKTVFDVLRKTTGYDGIIVHEASWGGDQTIYIAFHPEQIKNVDNLNPTSDPDIRRSLSENGEQPQKYGRYNVSGEDIRLEEVAPAPETTPEVTPEATQAEVDEMFPNDLAPIQSELSRLMEEKSNLEDTLYRMSANEEFGEEFNRISEQWGEINQRIKELESETEESESGRIDSLNDSDVPPETEMPYSGKNKVTVDNPFNDREWYDIGNKKVKAYMYDNPEVKPFFQEEAYKLMGELNDTTRGERWYDDQLYYESGGEKGFGGVKRHTSQSMETLLDSWRMSYADIEKGLQAIIEDNGAENIAAAKKIEFMLNDRLLNGYKDFYTNKRIEPNQDYINLLNEKQINNYSKESFDAFMQSADQYAPRDIAPVKAENVSAPAQVVQKFSGNNPNPNQNPNPNVAKILTEEPEVKKDNKAWSWFKNNVLDKGMVFEDLGLATGNRELQARWNSIRYAESKAQKLIGEGNAFTHSLNSIKESVEKTGKTKQFYEYLYHKHNIDRMTLEERFKDTPNKPVFGDTVTAEVSRNTVEKLERANPEFKQLSQDVYGYMNYLRSMLVDGGVISKETAELWSTMYPNYVPIRRAGDTGIDINVPLDTNRTGINAPIKRATGGSRDILPLFDTMGQRTLQTFKAIAKNRFGVELKNTLNTEIAQDQIGVDETIENIDKNDGLLQEGKNGQKPTFTVFENGQRVTFEITEEMYDAMKPSQWKFNSKTLNKISDFRRATLTEYNPWFMLKNAVKDVQDVFINSQHSLKTYASIPKAIKQMKEKGHYYQEYIDNGGEQNSYFDSETNTFKQEKEIPGLSLISKANNIVEMLPRLAEYIASREMGRSVDVAMLDSARVTTNFAAGGDLTKMLNRNGFTFLNASVQGAMQQVRNFREAKMNGLRGWAGLAGKFIASGLPVVLLNHLIWDDDEEYEEVPDYVKQNYYIVGKFGDGQFVRIPKGRTVAVIQEAFNQMDNLVTGDDEVDMKSFIDLVISNLAPNNPLDNNILSPVVQTLTNTTWYGEDLVPTRLQDLPSAEQYDESTDVISKWLGETTNTSPYKWNYLLDQYSGVIGDTFLPMLTPEAESGDNTFMGNMIAPLKDMFTTDSVMNNQNVSEFYDLKDELTITANGSNATDEDKLKSKYINSISSSMSELYQQKREIQNSDLPDDEKYAQVREIQQQIVDMMKEGMSNYQGITYEGEYARVGDRLYKQNEEGEWSKLSDEQVLKYEVTSAAGDAPYATDGTNHYRFYVKDGETEGEWRKITDEQLEKQEEVTNGLNISPEEYWGNKEEYDYAYENPENYAVAKAVGGYESYRKYSSELYDIKADKDEYGKPISGSRKEKVLDYINNLNADYYTKLILYKSEYTSYDDENMEIINYLNDRDDISYEEMKAILLKLGFYVDSQGNISWD